MKLSELNKIIRLLKRKRKFFNTQLKEFQENLFSSFAPINPEFEFDLNSLKAEIVFNFSFSDFNNVNDYYSGIIDIFRTDSFATTFIFEEYSLDYYWKFKNQESFLTDYYKDSPNDKLGEGEIEYIKLCFNGFLYSYKTLVLDIIKTIESEVREIKESRKGSSTKETDLTIKKVLNLNNKLSDDEIYAIITKNINYLYDLNAKELILNLEEYERLKIAIFELVKFDKVLDCPIMKKHPSLTIKSFRNSLHRIHISTSATNKIRESFVEFVYINQINMGSKMEKDNVRSKFSE